MKVISLQWKRIIESILLIIVLASGYLVNIKKVPFHGDESTWIATSLFLEAAINPNFSPPEWNFGSNLTEEVIAEFPSWVKDGLGDMQPPNDTWDTYLWTLDQPMMGRYIIATGRLLFGITTAELNNPWEYWVNEAENIARGNYPSAELLFSARLIMTVLAICSGIILFLLVRKSTGVIAGWCFVFFYAGSSYLLTHLRRAMGESPTLFFTCLAMLAGWQALCSWEKKQNRFWSIFWLALMGVAAGLAGASKLNGLGIAFGGVLLAWLMAFSKQREIHLRERLVVSLGGSLLVLGFCIGIFFIVDPYLYPNPLARTAAMFTLRARELLIQQQNPIWGITTFNQWIDIIPRGLLDEYAVFHLGFINGLLGL
ncbi:ArnT family glycosyltransferase, partial [Chloroflexota bacterium]